jgi:hypothetical protein
VKQLFPGVNSDNKMPTVNITTPYQIQFDPARWPWNNTWRSYQWKDDMSWSHGTHNLRFGAAYMYTKKYQPTDQNIGGNFAFNGTATGSGLADFLLGYAASFQQPSYRTAVNIANHTINLYAQDDWRVTKRLTLNLGLRWEWLPHAYDQNNQLSNFYPELYDPAQAPTFIGGNLDPNGPGFRKVPGTPLQNTSFYLNGVAMAGNGIPKGLTDNTWKTFAPRVGFAYDLTGRGNTVLRGGFGMFYERVAGNEQYNEMNNVPFVFQPTVNYVLLDNQSVGYQDGATINANDPNARSVGSFFINPILTPEEFAALQALTELYEDGRPLPNYVTADGRLKISAAWLIEHAGFARGHACGNVGLSTKHALALVNRGGATAREVIAFAREIRNRVRDRFGITLIPEPTLIGISIDEDSPRDYVSAK